MNAIIGKATERVDGRAKVTGTAKYSAEFEVSELAHGVMVQSTITKGRIKSIDASACEAHPGIIKVITYKNSLSLHQLGGESSSPGSGKLGEKDLLPLQSDRVFYDGQHVALVVGESLEAATHGARLLQIEYEEETPVFEIEQALPDGYKPKGGAQVSRGDVKSSLANAAVRLEGVYTTPVYHHNPMEPHATIAEWKDDQLTIYDATQSVFGSRNAIAQMLGIQPDKVRLVCLYLGGGFGCKGFTWPHSVLAPMAAKIVGRPVSIVLERIQMFSSNGRRSQTVQQIALGATKEGKLESVHHASTVETSFVEQFVEQAGVATKLLYASPNLDVSHTVVRVNKGTPCPTRAPGEAVGTFSLEVALDELAERLNMDPVALRLSNYASANPQDQRPWSSKHLDECYTRGAEAIGWRARNAKPGSVREGNWLVGYGMATAIYPANRGEAAAKVRMYPDGRVVGACCTQDIGTGTYTILAQTVAEVLGVPLEMIEIKLGDTLLPKGPNSGGSQTAASAGPAVRAAALDLRTKLVQRAIQNKKSPLFGASEDAVVTGG